MNNKITASVEFYFKGKKLAASIDLDLDRIMETTGLIPALHTLLARSINLDIYSYEYEMMQAETVIFSRAEGLAAQYLSDSGLDVQSFENAWLENKVHNQLQDIAQRHLLSDTLDKHPDIKQALLDAYHLGTQQKKRQS